MSIELSSAERQGGRLLFGARDTKMFKLTPYILSVCKRGELSVMIV